MDSGNIDAKAYHLPKDFCQNLEKIETCRKDNNSLSEKINKLHEQFTSTQADEVVVLTQKQCDELRNNYEEAINLATQQTEYIDECISNLDTLLSASSRRGSKSTRLRTENPQRSSYLFPQEEKRQIPVGRQVAAKISEGDDGDESGDFWILAAVVRYLPAQDKYEVEDEDPGDENDPNPTRKHYLLPTACVIELPTELAAVYRKHEAVLAMFPTTTTFYPAVVERAPVPGRKRQQDYHLKFEDDEENGVIPARPVNFRYVIKLGSSSS
eukprot:gb/GECH01010490.1/.p1 GENE.gb/GECH01010490.1/~~gb/GECH01010490.1/.p1  ORF type:complete len:269 (+),score=86.64 gb/GECH01010490.1/:1-807(+)